MAESRTFKVVVSVDEQWLTDNGYLIENLHTATFDEDQPIRELIDYINGLGGAEGVTLRAHLSLDGHS